VAGRTDGVKLFDDVTIAETFRSPCPRRTRNAINTPLTHTKETSGSRRTDRSKSLGKSECCVGRIEGGGERFKLTLKKERPNKVSRKVVMPTGLKKESIGKGFLGIDEKSACYSNLLEEVEAISRDDDIIPIYTKVDSSYEVNS